MANNNQNLEKLMLRTLHLVCDILMAICCMIARALLWIAKNFWKRYLGIETPVYKLWWKSHAKSMQKKLDRRHQINC